LTADYPETADLLHPWSAVREVFASATASRPAANSSHIIPAIPPFYWRRCRPFFSGTPRLVPRPPDALFYDNEQEYYLSFARQLGYPAGRQPLPTLPIPADR